ncbi:hypothetical protein Taro_017862 [Colocasia esculenta]|uniref:Uncharacterized protein n=1 Tax=Colocasia esculenta TaxID=4460 RepID=A0A843UPC8_COLES|nr:hypothetical protein [Colocasia esculenta]
MAPKYLRSNTGPSPSSNQRPTSLVSFRIGVFFLTMGSSFLSRRRHRPPAEPTGTRSPACRRKGGSRCLRSRKKVGRPCDRCRSVAGSEEEAVVEKMQALKELMPSSRWRSGREQQAADESEDAAAADCLFEEAANYIVLLKTRVGVLQKLVDLYGSGWIELFSLSRLSLVVINPEGSCAFCRGSLEYGSRQLFSGYQTPPIVRPFDTFVGEINRLDRGYIKGTTTSDVKDSTVGSRRARMGGSISRWRGYETGLPP